MRRLTHRIAATCTSALLLSCGGGDSPTPPGDDDEGQSVTVTVTTTGVDLDTDGYTVRLGTRSATVNASGAATFDDVAPGSYDLTLDGVANNCLVEGAAMRTISVTASSGASASFAIDCGVDFADGVPTVACEGLTLATNSGTPLGRVSAGVPSGLDAPFAARILTEDRSATGVAWFEDDGAGGIEFQIPLHPSGEREGGRVWVRATDGTAACAPVAFDIEALPAAPGELGRVVDALQVGLRDQLAALETTPEDLTATPVDQVDTVLLPAWAVHWVLGHPDNPNSLRAVADGASAEVVPLGLLDAVLARAGILDALAPSPAPGPMATPRPSRTVPASQCKAADVGSDGDKLAACMLARRDMEMRFDRFSQSLTAVLPRLVRHWGQVQQAPGIARAIIAGIGWAGLQQDVEIYAALPAILSGGSVDAIPTRFTEDDDRSGSWTLEVEARSLGWDYAEAALQGFLSGKIQSALARIGVPDPDHRAQIEQMLGSSVTAFLQTRTIPAETFGPARMDGGAWSKVEFRPKAGGVLAVDSVAHHTYQPIAAGVATMTVTTPVPLTAVPYGGPTLTLRTDLTVDTIKIRVEPSDTFVAPDATNVPFRITVDNALSPDSTSTTIEQGSASAPVGTFGNYSILYDPPAQTSFSNPDSIHVEYIGKTGPAATAPRRFGFAIVRFGEIVITPQPPCLDTLEQRTFSAEVKGLDNQGVTWSAVFGSIDSSGNYTAPPTRPTSGVDTIKATSVEEPELIGELVVPIGCSCNFWFRLGNRLVTAQAGDELVFNTENGRLWQAMARRPSEGRSVFMLPVDADPASRPNAPGPWPMIIQGTLGLTNPDDAIYATDPPPAATLTLEAFVPFQRARGTVNGPVYVVNPTAARTLNAEWFFSLDKEPGLFSCTVGGGP